MWQSSPEVCSSFPPLTPLYCASWARPTTGSWPLMAAALSASTTRTSSCAPRPVDATRQPATSVTRTGTASPCAPRGTAATATATATSWCMAASRTSRLATTTLQPTRRRCASRARPSSTAPTCNVTTTCTGAGIVSRFDPAARSTTTTRPTHSCCPVWCSQCLQLRRECHSRCDLQHLRHVGLLLLPRRRELPVRLRRRHAVLSFDLWLYGPR